MAYYDDLQGRAAQAKAEADERGLKLEEIEHKYSSSISKGRIISQDIKSGTNVENGSKVGVVVSKGAEQIKVPNVVGKRKKKAQITLTK